MQDRKVMIVENKPISVRLWKMELYAPHIACCVKGGQFVMLEVSPTYDPMGRRAFAVADVRKENITIFYETVGRGTYLMANMKKGQSLRVFGPLGKGLFTFEGEKHLFIGGGVGLAGLTLHAKRAMEEGKEVMLIYGAKSAKDLGMKSWLEEENIPYIIYTEDGTEGRKGKVTEALLGFDNSWTVHACGPKAMLKAIKEEGKKFKLYLSLESRMACGWGVCLGCVVKTVKGYARVCYEGPVFKAEEVFI